MSDFSAEELLKKTRSRTTVVVRTQNFPDGVTDWEVSLPNDRPDLALLYNNLCNDLVGAALAKLGVEYSKFLIDQDSNRLNSEMETVIRGLDPGTTAS